MEECFKHLIDNVQNTDCKLAQILISLVTFAIHLCLCGTLNDKCVSNVSLFSIYNFFNTVFKIIIFYLHLNIIPMKTFYIFSISNLKKDNFYKKPFCLEQT